jgi:hypothetical protein
MSTEGSQDAKARAARRDRHRKTSHPGITYRENAGGRSYFAPHVVTVGDPATQKSSVGCARGRLAALPDEELRALVGSLLADTQDD